MPHLSQHRFFAAHAVLIIDNRKVKAQAASAARRVRDNLCRRRATQLQENAADLRASNHTLLKRSDAGVH